MSKQLKIFLIFIALSILGLIDYYFILPSNLRECDPDKIIYFTECY